MAMAAAKDPQLNEKIREANGYLKGIQIQPGSESPDGKKVAEGDPRVGGVDYGKAGQPNLSVMGFWMDAMQESGVPSDDPNVKAAMGFINRLQNRSESNPMPWAKAGENDGGFGYSLVDSKAGKGPGGEGFRSYGSMTYVGFKSMLYAGLAKDDPRVQAAYGWIRKYWRLDSNPNMPEKQAQEGLYYYYEVFAKALRAWGEPVIVDARGVKHNWREELIDAMAKRVRGDGSWVNETDRWNEGNPALVTAYCVLALQEALKK
jgi:squalene-hopene/tetraprenyl-beta-curcumene cyclase